MPTETHAVYGCSACGEDHDIEFHELTKPHKGYPWVGVCLAGPTLVYMRKGGHADRQAREKERKKK